MLIYGLDFTSAPCPRKPITCAVCTLYAQTLHVDDFTELTDFEQFEAFLAHPGPWTAGLDFPFGQPLKLVKNLGWGETWADYVSRVARMSKQEFVAVLAAYRRPRPKGDKQHLRQTDVIARSRSPMMLYGVPVGRMFFEGAPRLLKSGVQVVPCHMNGDDRVVVEANPALVARKWIGINGYKSDTRRKQTAAHQEARRTIVNGLRADCTRYYGFALVLDNALAADFIADPSGDRLDAVLCAVQTAWACAQPGCGIPAECQQAEGWIVEPDMKHPHSAPKRGQIGITLGFRPAK
jgi:hypothetical protein